LSRRILIAVCLTLCLASTGLAQQTPLPDAPTSPEFLSRYDFQLSAAALANDDTRYSWDVHFGGDIDVVDFVRGRVASYMDYQAMLGDELRPFDPNQGNYILELSTSYRIQRTEVAAIFHHVSRHLSDRAKVIPVAWNILGVRALRRMTLRDTTFDLVADVGGTTQHVNVDYRVSGNLDVVARRPLTPRVGLFARGVGHVMGVTDEKGRPTQFGGLVEGGIRLIGEAAVGELFMGYERRFDADPLDFEAQRWFLVGFRALRR
jgi:hypothetical protein